MLKRALTYCLIGFVLLVSLASFLLNSSTGLHILLFIGKHSLPGKLDYRGVTGTVLSPLSIQRMQYRDKQTNLVLENTKIQWHLSSLWKKMLYLKSLKIQRIQINDWAFENTQISGSFDPQKLRLLKFSTQQNHQRIQAHGWLTPSPPYATTLRLSVQSEAPLTQGRLVITGNQQRYKWTGSVQSPIKVQIQGSLSHLKQLNNHLLIPTFSYRLPTSKQMELQNLSVNIKGEYPRLNLQVHASQIKPTLGHLRINGHSDANLFELHGQAQTNGGTLRTKWQTTLSEPIKIKGTLDANNLDMNEYGIPFVIQSLTAKYQRTKTQSNQGQLQLDGHHHQRPVKIHAQINNGALQANVQQQDNAVEINGRLPFPLHLNAQLKQPAQLHPSLLGLHTKILGTAHLHNAQQATAKISILKGEWQNQSDTSVPPFRFQGGEIQATLNPQGLAAQGSISVDPNKTLSLKASLPKYTLNNPLNPQQALQGRLSLHINKLDFLTEINPNILHAQGTIQAGLNFNGTFGNPNINGDVRLQKGRLDLATQGISLTPIDALIQAKKNQWSLQGTMGNNLKLQGKGAYYPTITGTASIQGKEVLLINNNEYKIYLSPNLKMRVSKEATEISGTIEVPKATLKPQTFSSSVSTSDDVVFVDTNTSEDPPQARIKTNINLKMGKEVNLDMMGLTAKIRGSINLLSDNPGPFTANGKLSVVDGKFSAHGQELTITQGELFFAGGSPYNAAINIRASRSIATTNQTYTGSNQFLDFSAANLQTFNFSNQTTVGVQVSGRLTHPAISLFSEPSNLSQADILSMLILGRPANQASGASGQILLTAISSMNLGKGTKGTQLFSQLKSALGIDIGLDNQQTYDQQQNSVKETRSIALSKSFSKRLSVRYNAGIDDSESNSLTLTYLLNRFFNVQVTTSTQGSGIDFVYNHNQD